MGRELIVNGTEVGKHNVVFYGARRGGGVVNTSKSSLDLMKKMSKIFEVVIAKAEAATPSSGVAAAADDDEQYSDEVSDEDALDFHIRAVTDLPLRDSLREVADLSFVLMAVIQECGISPASFEIR